MCDGRKEGQTDPSVIVILLEVMCKQTRTRERGSCSGWMNGGTSPGQWRSLELMLSNMRVWVL